MKKIIGTLAIIFCLSTMGYCQFAKGRFLVGGSFSTNFNSSKYKSGGTTTTTGKTSSINFYPQVGYFFIDNFAAGAGLDIGSGSYTANNQSSKVTTTSISLVPFARYYFDKFYAQATVQVGSSTSKSDAPNSTTSQVNNSGWSLAGGYAYMLNDHVAIEPQIGYGVNYYSSGSSSGKAIDGGLFLKVGLQVYLGK